MLQKDCFNGRFIGLALGDALGTTVEFSGQAHLNP